MNEIIIPVLVLSVLGIAFALILAFASKVFFVKVDEKVLQVRGELPGANCGACGFPGCDGLAKAIAEGNASITSCPVGGSDLVARLARILGTEAGDVQRMVACVMCQGDKERAKEKYIYTGIRDCRVNNSMQGGSKTCSYGCLGCGTCQDVCGFNAIEMINGLAVVNKENCTACNKCIDICPKNLIDLVPYEQTVMVKCKSFAAGNVVKNACQVGCIGCKMCVRVYPEAFSVENNLAVVNYAKGLDEALLLQAADKCPTNAIHPGLVKKMAEQVNMAKAV
ncbi:MAG: RnfABCDGE type electron transport complex subunit B [Peptoniphilaceae bacterium]|uniref:RnfABCDGE type electron transport complex subunit B n=1 Tax=Parvimonas sp. TaxID=1944660 RepID=UPI0025EA91F6|nr:RnfABCDGE type electron transport complex subunit B [Parvimonas sp.]MCI5997465.1 RnfABCDGE type electron transport complex subunit B [Parvimonas sp.]MDD7764173.1 RnfABCDGE type electron transport complex subunit B [Peptoniphilaceae bacterium]MDY3050378.1 RnfABCDGE type electron transport complex subunit B [Parvimonas sp.]